MQRAKQRENKLEAMRHKARLRAADAARLPPLRVRHRRCGLTPRRPPLSQLRKACLARVRASRTTLLASLRARGAVGDAAHVDDEGPELGAHLRQLLAEELQRGGVAGGAGARARAAGACFGRGAGLARR